MEKINRDIDRASKTHYDLVIIGGGIYGIMLAFLSAFNNIKTLLVEKNDFGSETSYNSLRIVHGGLRYLQSLDLHRFFESVGERKWFLQNFPELVNPLPCLMPLYGNGVYKPSIFRAALLLNDILSFNRNSNVNEQSRLEGGKVVSSDEVLKIFPQVDTNNLKGGALWYDGSLDDSQKMLTELVRITNNLGADTLNYSEFKSLVISNNNVQAVKIIDRTSGDEFCIDTDKVINAAGPWSRSIAKYIDKDISELFKPSIAWNLLLDKEPLSDHALAVTPKREGAKAYFIRPWKGKIFAGTIHEPWDCIERHPMPSKERINQFIEDLNFTIPNFNIREIDILHLFSGLLPAKSEGSNEIAVREIILDHSENSGPNGFYSVSGVKFTTARLVAEKTLKKVFKDKKIKSTDRESIKSIKNDIFNLLGVSNGHFKLDSSEINSMSELIKNDSIVHLDDLIIRRTSLGSNPQKAIEYSKQLADLFDWSDDKKNQEINRVKKYFNFIN